MHIVPVVCTAVSMKTHHASMLTILQKYISHIQYSGHAGSRQHVVLPTYISVVQRIIKAISVLMRTSCIISSGSFKIAIYACALI